MIANDVVGAAAREEPFATREECDTIYNNLHPGEVAAAKGNRFYAPLYVALNQPGMWCTNPACYRPVSLDAKCPLCRNCFCGQKCLVAIHKGPPNQTKEEAEKRPPTSCGWVDQTDAVRNFLYNLFLMPESPKDLTVFKEYRLIQMLEELLTLAIVHGKNYATLSTMSRDELFVALNLKQSFQFIDAMGLHLRQANLRIPTGPKSTAIFQCASENILQSEAGVVMLLIIALELLITNAGRAQLFMSAAALIHAAQSSPHFNEHAYVGVTQSADAIRPEFVYGEALASPLNIFKADQAVKWPVCYYCIMLVPLDVADVGVRRAMQFSVGLYVTPKDAMVIASVGSFSNPGAGYGIVSLLFAHDKDKANAYVNRKELGAQKHLTLMEAERWLRRLDGLTLPDADKDGTGSTPAARETIIREALAIGRKLTFPMPFPRYRIVTSRVIVNIV